MPTRLSTARGHLEFALGLGPFLRRRTTVDEAKLVVAEQLANREENFLRVLRTQVYDQPLSPYRALLAAARIGHADVERMVAARGLEGALHELFDAGVYVTFEELKGRAPIVRDGVELAADATRFDSPDVRAGLVVATSGSTGTPTRTQLDLHHIAQQAKHMLLGYHMQDLLDAPAALWRGMLPDSSGVGNILRHAHMGKPMDRFFVTSRVAENRPAWLYTLLTYLLPVLGRLHGEPFPWPRYVPLDDPLPIVRWLQTALAARGKALVRTGVSKAVRISLEAQARHVDLTGAVFFGAGEAPSPAKLAAIAASGARHVTIYPVTEVGLLGLACDNPLDGTDVHLMTNHVALLQRPVPVADRTVDAFCLTTLLPTSPKTLLNVLIDDCGIVETRACGCLLGQLGFAAHLRQIQSYGKLTGEGVTLIGSDVVHILEHVLPARFGGGPLDYQLVEEEDTAGLTRMVLHVDPSIAIADEAAVVETFLAAMRHGSPGTQNALGHLRDGRTLGVRRAPPLRGGRGKHLPIRTLGNRAR
jgi:hypothetical protein